MDEYISKEKAIKELREVYENEYPTASGDFDEYASHDVPNVLKNMPAADVQPVKRGKWDTRDSGGWISCEDRLPKENILVLCYARSTTGEGNSCFLGAIVHGEFWFLQVNDIGHVSFPVPHWEVTHWQPLPKSPKGGDTE